MTRHLVAMGSNKALSLKQLSKKLVILMALIEASRTLELRALDIRFRTYRLEGVVLRLASLTKKRSRDLPPKEPFFTEFPSDKLLCVLKCLKHYKERTREFRSSDPGEKPLLLSYVRPNKPVTFQRLVHWVKDLMADAWCC